MTFPPAYQRLPDGVRVKNKKTGEVIELDQEYEEYATWFAPMEGSEFGEKPNVQINLWGYIGPGVDKVSDDI